MKQQLLEMLMRKLKEEVDQGKLPASRAREHQAVLGEMQAILMEGDEGSLPEIQDRNARVRALMLRAMATVGERQAGDERLGRLTRSVQQEMIQPMRGEKDRNAAHQLYERCIRLEMTRNAADLSGHDYESSLRRVATDVQRFARRINAGIAVPLWDCPATATNPGAAFFSGRSVVEARFRRTCDQAGLRLATAPSTDGHGQRRWNALRSAAVAVFDLGGPASAERSSVYYELGLAFVLGIPTAVLAPEGEPVAFNLEEPPSIVPATGATEDQLLAAVEAALFTVPRREWRARPTDTVEYLERVLELDAGIVDTLSISMKSLREAVTDPTLFAATLETALAMLREGSAERGLPPGRTALVVRPPYPPAYPAAGERRCFHVTSFAPEFEGPSWGLERACLERGLSYDRGDARGDVRVIRSIWDKIASATCVVVDLTPADGGPNRNVCFELGLAHALGRPTALVSSGASDHARFTSISRLQVRRYDVDAPGADLAAALDERLKESGGTQWTERLS